ncbi:NUDIX hydrolase [Macrococcus lamae]|uniref:NUDIX hydrolase n=1 Tax=Macrococcus lamae TaxID=198484 RepID=A0A4R6BYG8_9STAP|nr:NUDIX hydrolase [Macrococcus lamae]TDM13310.1 NUDIX hydrolase [Macrococcus lamae]
MTFEERTLHVEEIYNGKIIKVEKHQVELPNGHETTREVVKHPGAVAVLAIHNGKVLLIRQFRKAMEELLIEVPAGKVELGEDREKTALRELEEETGFTTDSIDHIYDFYVSPGFCDELISLYYAENLIESSELTADEDEFIEKMWVPVEEINALLLSGKVRDSKTILALQHFLLNYNNSK